MRAYFTITATACAALIAVTFSVAAAAERMKLYKWVDENGSDIFNLHCRHLRMEIKDTFGVKVKKKKWTHWNGGVFLFDKDSVVFLKFWHDLVLKYLPIQNGKHGTRAL